MSEPHRLTADKIMLRVPDGMRERIKAAAADSRRSMNSEIVFHLERALPAPSAATGAGFADTTPAAAQNHAALAGGEIINPDV
ncbi:Arc family DNA-binding protein [Aquabacter sp. CN5-332]|uniref:Arc family DNA-binding protein n=1 Tax=Aquabacter sp. CN5-332 TaxID=3156608 RepID=UPI0032B382CD